MSHHCSILTGDETGLLKYICVNENNNSITSYGEQSRSGGIIGLDWVERNKMSVVLRTNSNIEIWNFENKNDDSEDSNNDEKHKLTLERQIHVESLTCPAGCLSYSTNGTSNINDKLISYSNDGAAVIVDLLRLNLDHIMNLKGPISCGNINNNSASNLFAYGGNENDLKIFDINSLTNCFEAKNVSQDKLRLRVPIWITCLSFLATDNKVVTGTAYKHMRIYDTKADRRPIMSIDIGEYRISSLLPSNNENQIYIGDVTGSLSLWDLRIQRQVKSMSSFTGSVRDIKSNGKNIACVSLDRNLKVYNTNKDKDKYSSKNNRMVSTIYLKNRLTKCLIFDDTNHISSDSDRSISSVESSDSDNDNENDGDFGDDDEDEDRDKLIELNLSSDDDDDDDNDEDVDKNVYSDSDEHEHKHKRSKIMISRRKQDKYPKNR